MIHNVISKIRTDMISIFAELNSWFDKEDRLLNYDPPGGGWSVRKILEHVSLTNYFLLVLIRKGTNHAMKKAKKRDLSELPSEYEFNWIGLISIGNHMSFQWHRPEHMEPTNQIPMSDVRERLIRQQKECLSYLDQMPNGEGALHKIMMSVNGLGKIDVYHYIFFLVQHIRRHILQMERIRIEMKNQY